MQNVSAALSISTPFQQNIKAVIFSSDEELLLIVKFKVAVCVQPDSLVDSNVSAALSMGSTIQSKLSQAVIFSSDEELLLIVKFKVAVVYSLTH